MSEPEALQDQDPPASGRADPAPPWDSDWPREGERPGGHASPDLPLPSPD